MPSAREQPEHEVANPATDEQLHSIGHGGNQAQQAYSDPGQPESRMQKGRWLEGSRCCTHVFWFICNCSTLCPSLPERGRNDPDYKQQRASPREENTLRGPKLICCLIKQKSPDSIPIDAMMAYKLVMYPRPESYQSGINRYTASCLKIEAESHFFKRVTRSRHAICGKSQSPV